jgi:hypothetical protein
VVQTPEAGGGERHCTLEGGVPLDEEIVTNDRELRRLQCASSAAVCPSRRTWAPSTSSSRTTEASSSTAPRSPRRGADTLGPAIEDGVRLHKDYCETH